MTWPDCDVCGRPAKGVAGSVLGAISFAYCQECLIHNADVKSLIEFTLNDCGGEVAEWVKDMTYYENGEYRSVRELLPDAPTRAG